MPFQLATAPSPNNRLTQLATLLATGLLRWHQQRLLAGNPANSAAGRLELSAETVLSVISPKYGIENSEN